MSDYEISDDVKQQAQEAVSGMDAANTASASDPSLYQPEPFDHGDMSQVPDPYDVVGQTQYREEKRDMAVEANAASDAPVAQEASTAEYNSLSSMSDAEMDKALNAAAGIEIQGGVDDLQAESVADPSPEYGQPESTMPTPTPSLSPEQDMQAPAPEPE